MDSGTDSGIVRFLVTTDNHLGYLGGDRWRADDSFVSFEECLHIGRVKWGCDGMLLGGDLFHYNKPSLSTLSRTMSLFRQYIFGKSNEPGIELLSDAVENFGSHHALPLANFEDPNLNIAMPIFSIHGNHDDAAGSGVSSLDLFASAGHLNYFGHISDLEDITLRPVLLRKRKVYIALYGIGHVRDERLHRCFSTGKVRLMRPADPPGDAQWFSILLLHQNRGVRGGLTGKNGLPESYLHGFGIDLVIWGNEHDQLFHPQTYEQDNSVFDVTQPGSTISTSITSTASPASSCGVLEIHHTGAYRLHVVPLRSLRPMIYRQVVLAAIGQDHVVRTLESVSEFLDSIVELMLLEAHEKEQLIPSNVLDRHSNLRLPVLRLQVDYSAPVDSCSASGIAPIPFPRPNPQRFGEKYVERVANPGDLLKAVPASRSAAKAAMSEDNLLLPKVMGSDVRAKVLSVLQQNVANTLRHAREGGETGFAEAQCRLLSEVVLLEGIVNVVDKGNSGAVSHVVEELLTKARSFLCEHLEIDDPTQVGLNTIAEVASKHKQQINAEHGGSVNELSRNAS